METRNVILTIVILALIGLLINSWYQQRNWKEEWLCLPTGWRFVDGEAANKSMGCNPTDCKDVGFRKNALIQDCQCGEGRIEFYCEEQFMYRKFIGEF